MSDNAYQKSNSQYPHMPYSTHVGGCPSESELQQNLFADTPV